MSWRSARKCATANRCWPNGLNWNTQVMGESPDYPQIRNWTIASGSMFGDQDVRSLAKSAIIGQTVVDQLFPNENPVGQTIRIRNLPFQIVGVLAPKGFNLFGQDQDDTSSSLTPATCTASPPALL